VQTVTVEKQLEKRNAVETKDLNVYYGSFHALKNVRLSIKEKAVTALIGPSGCGKSTFLRTINRMNDMIPNFRVEGKVLVKNKDVYAPDTDVVELRKNVGMVFQRPNPFPMSIYDNVAYGPRIHGIKKNRIWISLSNEA